MDEKACKIFNFNSTQDLEPVTTLEITARAENCEVTKPFIQIFLVEKSSVSKGQRYGNTGCGVFRGGIQN